MDNQRVPNLEELDEQQAHRFLTELFSHLSPEEEYNMRHQDYTMEMPQSGERFRGRENMRAFQEAYPNPPNIQLRRVLVRDGLWVAEGVNDYGGGQVAVLHLHVTFACHVINTAYSCLKVLYIGEGSEVLANFRERTYYEVR